MYTQNLIFQFIWRLAILTPLFFVSFSNLNPVLGISLSSREPIVGLTVQGEKVFSTPDLIQQAFARGGITEEERLLYLAYALGDQDKLPFEYHSSVPWSGTVTLLELRGAVASQPAVMIQNNATMASIQEVLLDTSCGDNATVLPNTVNTAHFFVEYNSIVGGLDISDYLTSLESVWNGVVYNLGWAAPPVLFSNPPPGNLYHVRIDSLPLGLTGFVDSVGTHAGLVGDNLNTPWNDVDAYASCLVLNHDYSPFVEYGTRQEMLNTTIAHEFTHAIQYGYGAVTGPNTPDLPFIESSAAWMEEEIYESANVSINSQHLWPTFDKCMGEYTDLEKPYQYNYSYWNMFRGLTERFGVGSVGGGEEVMQDFWEETSKSANSNMLPALNTALQNKGTALADAYHDYAIAVKFNKVCGGEYVYPYCLKEGPEYVQEVGDTSVHGSITAVGGSYTGNLADNYAINWIGLPTSGIYSISLENTSAGGQFRASIVADTGNMLVITPMPNLVNGNSIATLPSYQPPEGDQSVVAVITNQSQTADNPTACGLDSYILSLGDLSTPTPTITPSPLPTSTATFTPLPTSTPLPAAGTLTCYSDNPSIFDCVQIDPYTVRWNIIGNPSTAPNIAGQFQIQYPNQPVYVTAHWDAPDWVSIHGWQTNPEGRYGIIGLPSVYVNDGGYGTPCSFNPDKLCGDFAVGTWNFIQPAVTNSFNRATVGFQIYPDPPATVHWNPQNAYLIVSSVGYGGAPTPQPTPTSSCPWWEPWFLCPGTSGQSNVQQLKLVSLASSKLVGTLEEVVLDVQLFYRVRDELLSLTPQGNHLIDLYYQYGPEIGGLLLADSGLYQEGVSLLQIWEPKLRALVDSQGNTVTISQVEVDAVENFLLNLEAVASNELRTVLQDERIILDMQGFVGQTMSQAWDEINTVETPTPTATPTYTPTNTSTPTSTPTLTSTPTYTPTVTPTSTFTSTPAPVFPMTGILDDFNRANGGIGSAWSGNSSKYSISSNQLLVTSNNSNSDIYWSGQAFGADQEVYVTFANIHASAAEQDLILKSQSATIWSGGMIEVWYDAPGQRVQVWTWEWPAGWVQHGADIPVTFVNGDTFGARALANGNVEVYKNGALLGVRDVTSWSYYAQGGYIGLWFIGAQNARLDDFGGGAISNGMQSLVAGQAQTNTASADALDVQVGGTSAFWQGIPLSETASVTITQIQTGKQTLSLKPKSNGVSGEGVVQVFYDLANGRIQLWMYDPAQGWVQVGKDTPIKFAVGDTFTVRTFADGRLEILRNRKLLAKTDVIP